MTRPLVALVAVPLAALAAGCGNRMTAPPETQAPDAPQGTRVVRYPKQGIRFTAPFNWPDLAPEGQRVGGVQNKRASVVVWRYGRSEPLPTTKAALKEVERLLIERVKKRDPTFQLEQSQVRRRGGAPAIELLGRETTAGLPYGVRSSHVFFAGNEIVVDAYAPPEYFPRVDSQVFVPLLDSLRLKRP